jgi:hypothetical protein
MTTPALWSASLKTGRGMLFLDLKVAKNGTMYLSLSESAFTGEGAEQKRVRTTIRIFGEGVNSLKAALADMPSVETDPAQAKASQAAPAAQTEPAAKGKRY